jgi:hypothetical protein
MTVDASTADTTTDTTTDTVDEPGKTFTQEQVNTFLAEQKRKIGDVKELKAAAAELAAIKESQKTDAQKTADRLAAADAEVATIPAKVSEALRVHLIALHQIPVERAELYLTATDPELLLKQVAGLVELDGKKPNHVPSEGKTPTSGSSDDMREFTRNLFAKDD